LLRNRHLFINIFKHLSCASSRARGEAASAPVSFRRTHGRWRRMGGAEMAAGGRRREASSGESGRPAVPGTRIPPVREAVGAEHGKPLARRRVSAGLCQEPARNRDS
jgi:hypothetical protein